MTREEKINKMIETIKERRNDELYIGGPFPIYHIEFDLLSEEIDRLNNIINELEKHFEMLELNSNNGNKEFFEDIVLYIRKLKELKEKNSEID